MLSEPVPLVIRNAPTGLMKDLDYGKGYVYAHDTKDKIADMECLPESLAGTRYYLPQDAGEETKQKGTAGRSDALARGAEKAAAGLKNLSSRRKRIHIKFVIRSKTTI